MRNMPRLLCVSQGIVYMEVKCNPFPSAEHNKFHNSCLFRTAICMEIHQLTRHFVGYQGVCFSAKIWLSIRKPIGTKHFRGGNGSWHFQLIPR